GNSLILAALYHRSRLRGSRVSFEPSRFCCDLFVQNLADSEWFDFGARGAAEPVNLEKRIATEFESDEVTRFSFGSLHRGFECIDVGSTYLVRLFHLDRIPNIHEIHFDVLLHAIFRHRAHWVDSAVDSQITNLR